MNTVQSRLGYWRRDIKKLSLRELQARVNAHLPREHPLSLGTVSNYERLPDPGAARPGPRAEFLVALKRAFPDLRIDWLLLGEGEPTELAERLATPEGLDAAGSGVGPGGGVDTGALARRVLERCPDLELLSPEASALFMGALTRYAVGEPKLALAEEALLDLANDLAWLLFLPVTLWGFDHTPSYDDLSNYGVAMLHALMQLMPGRGSGDPIEEHAGSGAPRLRRFHPSGFAA